MPTYILHGGAAARRCEENAKFHAHVASFVGEGETLLLVYFAADESDWARKLEHDTRNLTASKGIKIEVASEENFEEQVSRSKVIYFRDGYTEKLFKAMSKFEKELLKLEGKVYVGSSAGANLLCNQCYSAPVKTFMAGAGVLPFHVLIHANNEEYKVAYETLKNNATAEITFLPLDETKFITVEI